MTPLFWSWVRRINLRSLWGNRLRTLLTILGIALGVAILLAIHPTAMEESEFFWSENDLRDILYDTIDLYKIRMVDLEAIQEYGYLLPMTYWFNIPGNK